jgi:hypothetical protein
MMLANTVATLGADHVSRTPPHFDVQAATPSVPAHDAQTWSALHDASARLRKRFQLVKEKLVTLGKQAGLFGAKED